MSLNLKLRKFKLSDLDDFYAITSNINIMKYIAGGVVWSKEKTEGFIRWNMNHPDDLNFAIIERKTGDFVGMIGIKKNKIFDVPNPDNAYLLTIFLAENKQGKRYGTEVVQTIICKYRDYDIYASILNNNIPSIMLFKHIQNREIFRDTRVRVYRLYA